MLLSAASGEEEWTANGKYVVLRYTYDSFVGTEVRLNVDTQSLAGVVVWVEKGGERWSVDIDTDSFSLSWNVAIPRPSGTPTGMRARLIFQPTPTQNIITVDFKLLAW